MEDVAQLSKGSKYRASARLVSSTRRSGRISKGVQSYRVDPARWRFVLVCPVICSSDALRADGSR